MKLHKSHPTTSTKGDISCPQGKAVGRLLRDLKCIEARKSFVQCLLKHLKVIIHSVFMLGYEDKVVNTELFLKNGGRLGETEDERVCCVY